MFIKGVVNYSGISVCFICVVTIKGNILYNRYFCSRIFICRKFFYFIFYFLGINLINFNKPDIYTNTRLCVLHIPCFKAGNIITITAHFNPKSLDKKGF